MKVVETIRRDPIRAFWWVLGLSLLFKLVLAAVLPLTQDEAYFTMWGEFPALGYSEHPPMIGWILWPILAIGKTRFLVRLPAVFATVIIGWGIFRLLEDRDRERAALTAILYLLSPLNLLYVIITTDTPLIFFSFWSMFAYYRAYRSGRLGWYAAAGLLLSFAFLSKYFAVLLGFAYLVHFIVAPKNTRRVLGIGLLYLAVLPAGLLDIYWNYHHSWLQINSNLFYRNAGDGPNIVTPLVFLATVLYLLLPAGVILWWRARKEFLLRLQEHDAAVFAVLYLVPMSVFALLSVAKKIGLHWLLSFCALSFLISWAVIHRHEMSRAIRFTIRFSMVHVILIVVVLLIPIRVLQGSSNYASIVMSKHHRELAAAMAPFTEDRMLGAEGYGLACLLSFYNPGFFSHFARGTIHGRQDDVITDWRDWAGRDVMIFHREPPEMERYEGLFDQMRVETIEVEGQIFYLLLGDRLDFDAFRDRVLAPIRDRFYQVPEWLPMEQCFFRGRYFPDGPRR